MSRFAPFLRNLAKLRYRLLNRATIKGIPTEEFNSLLEEFLYSGWKSIYRYQGFDAWVDFGKVKLKNRGVTLAFVWDNRTEGSIEGPASFIEALAEERGLSVTQEWRWAEYDEA